MDISQSSQKAPARLSFTDKLHNSEKNDHDNIDFLNLVRVGRHGTAIVNLVGFLLSCSTVLSGRVDLSC